ncbi:MAG: hypothetical protein MI924_06660 [Chloroflexales bacterium]|nr:hypothetical protein [Chloroflexales bacterium]
MLNRSEVIEKIESRLSGELSDATLAAWAFGRFYATDMGNEPFAEEDAATIRSVLDDLMFCDNPHFALDTDALHQLIVRLKEP